MRNINIKTVHTFFKTIYVSRRKTILKKQKDHIRFNTTVLYLRDNDCKGPLGYVLYFEVCFNSLMLSVDFTW